MRTVERSSVPNNDSRSTPFRRSPSTAKWTCGASTAFCTPASSIRPLRSRKGKRGWSRTGGLGSRGGNRELGLSHLGRYHFLSDHVRPKKRSGVTRSRWLEPRRMPELHWDAGRSGPMARNDEETTGPHRGRHDRASGGGHEDRDLPRTRGRRRRGQPRHRRPGDRRRAAGRRPRRSWASRTRPWV